MDVQKLMKRYGENTPYLKAIKVGEWIGEHLRRARGMRVHIKRPVTRIRARHA